MKNKVIVVDKQGKEIGYETLNKVHATGTLHRSFAIFIINSKNQLLLQKRSPHKLHAGNLWSNACTSHPRPGEKTIDAAHRRLREELGISCELQEAFTFVYSANYAHEHVKENEYGHIFIGFCDATPRPNREEVTAYQWMSLEQLIKDLNDHPKIYAPWLILGIDSVALYLKNFAKKEPLLAENPTYSHKVI